MTQRALTKLDALKRHEKKKLRKYNMFENQALGRVQFNPYERTPLTCDFKYYETPTTIKSNIPLTPHILEKKQSSVPRPESCGLYGTSRPELSAHLLRNNFYGKPVMRPSSGPNYLKCNLWSADGSFMIVKQKSKQNMFYFTSEVQKTPETISELHWLPTRTSRQDGKTMITKADATNQSDFDAKARSEPVEDLGKDSKSSPSFHFSAVGPSASKDSALKDDLIIEGERFQDSFIHEKDSVWKKEKNVIPLCIEDELENPNAKTISADNPKVKWQSSVTMSESFPIFFHDEKFGQRFVLNQWLSLYGKKPFDDLSRSDEASTLTNPVLQNNYNESIAIIRSKILFPSKIMAKRKKKPNFGGKPKNLTIQLLSLGRLLCNISAGSKKRIQFVRRTSRNVPRTIARQTEKTLPQIMPKPNKDILIISGKNPTGNIQHSTSTGISRVKSHLPACGGKLLVASKEKHKKGVPIFMDYVVISKSVPTYEPIRAVLGHGIPRSAMHSDTQMQPAKELRFSSRSVSAKVHVRDRNQGSDLEVRKQELHLQSSVDRSGERESEMIGSSFPAADLEEINNSLESEQSAYSALYSEDPYTCSSIISIPTAQSEASESQNLMVSEANSGYSVVTISEKTS